MFHNTNPTLLELINEGCEILLPDKSTLKKDHFQKHTVINITSPDGRHWLYENHPDSLDRIIKGLNLYTPPDA